MMDNQYIQWYSNEKETILQHENCKPEMWYISSHTTLWKETFRKTITISSSALGKLSFLPWVCKVRNFFPHIAF